MVVLGEGYRTDNARYEERDGKGADDGCVRGLAAVAAADDSWEVRGQREELRGKDRKIGQDAADFNTIEIIFVKRDWATHD